MAYRDLIDLHEQIVEPNVGHEAMVALAEKRDNAKSDAARRMIINRMVEHNMRLASHFVHKRYSNFNDPYLDLDDIIQHANMALMRAAEKWNPEKSMFSTYATQWIRSFIQDALCKRHTIHLPRQVQRENPELIEEFQTVSTESVSDLEYIEDESPAIYQEIPESAVTKRRKAAQRVIEPEQIALALPIQLLLPTPKPKKRKRAETKLLADQPKLRQLDLCFS
jgi:RNA polymerase sigma factor (sigma-70 family)